MSASLVSLLQEVDFLAAEQQQQAARGPEFVIFHLRVHNERNEDEFRCIPDEEQVVSVMLRHDQKTYQMPLSPSSLVVFDILSACRLGRTARQIVSDDRERNSIVSPALRVASVKLLIRRIRQQMQAAFQEAGLKLDARSVLRSEQIDGRSVCYRLVAIRRWVHISKKRALSDARAGRPGGLVQTPRSG